MMPSCQLKREAGGRTAGRRGSRTSAPAATRVNPEGPLALSLRRIYVGTLQTLTVVTW